MKCTAALAYRLRILIALCSILSSVAAADNIVLGFSSFNIAQPATISGTIFFAQAFTLSTTTTLNDIELLGLTGATCPCTPRLDLTNNLGASVTTSIASFSFPLSSGTSAQFLMNTTLTPGQYFLVLSTSSGSFKWQQGASVVPSSVGGINFVAAATSVNSAFPPGSAFSFSKFGARGFQLTQTQVSEPSTLLLLAVALLGVLGCALRKI